MNRYDDLVRPHHQMAAAPHTRYADLVNAAAPIKARNSSPLPYTTRTPSLSSRMRGLLGDQFRPLGRTGTLLNDSGTGYAVLTGVAVPIGTWTHLGGDIYEQFAADAFDELISTQEAIPLHLKHDHKPLPIGVSTSWARTETALNGTWKLDTIDPLGAEVERKIRAGYLTGLSVGFVPGDHDEMMSDQDGKVWVTRHAGVRFFEVSVVDMPAYPDAIITNLS